MPGVEAVTAVPRDTSRHFESPSDVDLRRPNPAGDLELEFSRPGEIGMGASTWGQVRLLDRGRDVTAKRFPAARSLSASIGAIDFFYPWDHSGTRFTLPLMGRENGGHFYARLIQYDVANPDRAVQLTDTWCSGVVWSPNEDRILVIRHESAEIVDLDGHRQPISFPSHVGDGVLGAWTPDGSHVVLSGPPQTGKPERLQFIDRTTGTLSIEVPCDPLHLLPFDEEGFNELASGRFLIYPEDHRNPYVRWDSRWAIEALMHHWGTALYEASTSSLLLGTFRPTFELAPIPSLPRPRRLPRRRPDSPVLSPFFTPESFPEENQLACVMTKEWVKLTLGN